MGHGGKLSVADKLLLAANDLQQGGRKSFSAEDLVVAAWKKFPDVFGLSGHPDDKGQPAYPDSNRVFAEIMGSKPIRERGLLAKVGNKMYQITDAGREYARSLNSTTAVPSESRVTKAGLARPTIEALKKLLASKAVEKVKNNRGDDITFYDACAFWGISPMSSAIELEGRISNFEKIVETARGALRGKAASSFGHGGAGFGVDDLKRLTEVHNLLLEKFRVELAVIRQRGDERKT
jgi:hypothetical protein